MRRMGSICVKAAKSTPGLSQVFYRKIFSFNLVSDDYVNDFEDEFEDDVEDEYDSDETESD